MMKKIPYEMVAVEMEKLWNIKIDPSDVEGMNNHCDLLRGFVESCGWEIDHYILRMMNLQPEKN